MLEVTSALNSYNVAQLQYALTDPKDEQNPYSLTDDLSPSASPALIHPPDEDAVDYASRRMSSSAASAADTDSSILSRGEKRALSPPDGSPEPKKARQHDHQRGDHHGAQLHTHHWGVDEHHAADQKHALDGDGKVQLPSIFTSFEDPFQRDADAAAARRSSLPSLVNDSPTTRHRPYPAPNYRSAQPPQQQQLQSYTFPPSAHDTQYDNVYSATSTSNSNFPSALTSPYSARDDQWSPIVRPSSTPGSAPTNKLVYDDSMRHASFSGAPGSATAQSFAPRISGQARLKEEWQFSAPEFTLGSNAPPFPGHPSVPSSTADTKPPGGAGNTLADLDVKPPPPAVVNAPRKRGKLPKETTDFLKAWLHRHSDHPYPSEEEKKALCHATGLSMSQVSNWMINARRRILAPAHRAASNPTTTTPFPPSRGLPSSLLSDASSGRRGSAPSDSLQLYHPLSLQSLHHPPGYVGSTRHLLGLPPAPARGGSGGGPYSAVDYPGPQRGFYPPNAGGGGGAQYLGSSLPLSAPPTLSPSPFGHDAAHGVYAAQGQHAHQHHSPRYTTYADDNGHGHGHGHGHGAGSLTPDYPTPPQ